MPIPSYHGEVAQCSSKWRQVYSESGLQSRSFSRRKVIIGDLTFPDNVKILAINNEYSSSIAWMSICYSYRRISISTPNYVFVWWYGRVQGIDMQSVASFCIIFPIWSIVVILPCSFSQNGIMTSSVIFESPRVLFRSTNYLHTLQLPPHVWLCLGAFRSEVGESHRQDIRLIFLCTPYLNPAYPAQTLLSLHTFLRLSIDLVV